MLHFPLSRRIPIFGRRAKPAACALLMALAGTSAAAQSAPDGWTITVAPYFWAAGISGSVAQFGLPAVNTTQSFSDILDNIDFAVMGTFEARRGRDAIFGDLVSTRLTARSPTSNQALVDEVGLKTETFAALIGASRSIWTDGRSWLDLAVGLRFWDVSTDLRLSGGSLGNGTTSDGASWVNGLGGLRGRYDLSDRAFLSGWLLVGTGGADLEWDVAAVLGYQIGDAWALHAGYRILDVDYDHDGYRYDIRQEGPILGVTYRF